jgi:sterol desaturase/sphingolipid hydroxylase (fatty acid hydroxylase superfamily)
MLEAFPAHAWLAKIVNHLLTYDSYVIVMTWVTALLGAGLTFAIRSDHGYRKTFGNLLRFCFPAEILRNRSCRLDVLFAITIRFLTPLIIAPILITSAAVTQVTHDGLTAWFGSRPPGSDLIVVRVLALCLVVVLADGSNFCTHYLNHKVRLLWEFHKVHHAARFLIPITNRRVHPVQGLFDDTALLLPVGIWLGLISYIFGMPMEDNVVLGMDAFFFANLLSFYHLRHSHIPMSYGWLENVFMSPAQHQLHHSFVVRHWDRNFGLFLSCWDKMAGTFVASEPPGALRLGLPAEYESGYDTLAKLYVTPIVNVVRMAGRSLRARPGRGHAILPTQGVNADLGAGQIGKSG